MGVVILYDITHVPYSWLFSRSKNFAISCPGEFRGNFFSGITAVNTTAGYNSLGYDAEAITPTFFRK